MPTKAPVSQNYIQLKDAADYLNVTPQTISSYVNRGRNGVFLKTVMVGGVKKTTRHLCDLFVDGCSRLAAK